MSDMFPAPQPLTTAQQQRIRAVLDDAIAAAPSAAPRRRRWWVAAGGAAAATVGAISWAVFGFNTSPASAWAPFPQPVTGPDATHLQTDCQKQVRGHGWTVPNAGTGSALAEQRGASTAVLLVGGGGQLAICIDPHGSGQAFSGPLVGVTTSNSHSAVTADTAGGPGLGMWAVYGQVPARAAKVSVVLGDGQQVTASVGHGHYLAWWPVTAGSGSVRVTDAAGAVVTTVPLHLSTAAPVPRRSPR